MSQCPPMVPREDKRKRSIAGRDRHGAGIRIAGGRSRDSADRMGTDADAIPILRPIVGITSLSLGSQNIIPCVELLSADSTFLCNIKSRTRVALRSLAILCAKRRNAILRRLWSR